MSGQDEPAVPRKRPCRPASGSLYLAASMGMNRPAGRPRYREAKGMSARKKDRPTRRGWRSVAVLTGCVAVVAGAGYWVRSALLPRADAQTNVPAVRAPATAAPAPATQEPLSDYSRRVVAYVYDAEPITREQLGEYLIDRYGDKLDLLINKRIIDETCRQYNIDVTASEVETALAEELQG